MEKEELKYLLLNITNNIPDIEQKVEIVYNQYYGRRIYLQPYINSKNQLIRCLIEGEFPSAIKWDSIAKQKGYLSHYSLKYIEGASWKEIEIKLRKELKKLLQT